VVIATPLIGLLLLAWMARSRFAPSAVWVSVALLPILTLLAPSPLELALTIALEALIVWALAVGLGLDYWRAALTCGFINTFTQPLLYLALMRLNADGGGWRAAFIAGELLVCLVEAALYLACLEDLRRSRHAFIKALGVSLAANGASAILGLLLPV
jgi:hypothetical protein